MSNAKAIAARLFDLALENEHLLQAAKRVEEIGRNAAQDAIDGRGWSRPIDANGFMELVKVQKNVEMREALAKAVGATDAQIRGAYEHQRAGDLMRWIDAEIFGE